MLFGYIPDSHNAEIEESPLIKLENEFIKQIEFSNINPDYIYVLSFQNTNDSKSNQSRFSVINFDKCQNNLSDENILKISEQIYELPYNISKFIQNQEQASFSSEQNVQVEFCLNKFEIFFFNNNCQQLYTLCPVIPLQNLILSQNQFQNILINLIQQQKYLQKLDKDCESSYKLQQLINLLKQSKKTIREKPDFCIVDLEENLKYQDTQNEIRNIQAAVQGPFQIQGDSFMFWNLIDAGQLDIQSDLIYDQLGFTVLPFYLLQQCSDSLNIQVIVSIDRCQYDDTISGSNLQHPFQIIVSNENLVQRWSTQAISSVTIQIDSQDSIIHLFDRNNQELIIFQKNRQDYIRVNLINSIKDFITDLKSQQEDDKDYKLEVEYFPIQESLQNQINNSMPQNLRLAYSQNAFITKSNFKDEKFPVFYFQLPTMKKENFNYQKINQQLAMNSNQISKKKEGEMIQSLQSNFVKILQNNLPEVPALPRDSNNNDDLQQVLSEYFQQILLYSNQAYGPQNIDDLYQIKIKSLKLSASEYDKLFKWYKYTFLPFKNEYEKQIKEKIIKVQQKNQEIKFRNENVMRKLEMLKQIKNLEQDGERLKVVSKIVQINKFLNQKLEMVENDKLASSKDQYLQNSKYILDQNLEIQNCIKYVSLIEDRVQDQSKLFHFEGDQEKNNCFQTDAKMSELNIEFKKARSIQSEVNEIQQSFR